MARCISQELEQKSWNSCRATEIPSQEEGWGGWMGQHSVRRSGSLHNLNCETIYSTVINDMIGPVRIYHLSTLTLFTVRLIHLRSSTDPPPRWRGFQHRTHGCFDTQTRAAKVRPPERLQSPWAHTYVRAVTQFVFCVANVLVPLCFQFVI